MAEPNTIYKIAILSMLSKANQALSNGQILQFFVECEYTDYFTVQQALFDLQAARLLEHFSSHNQTMYRINTEGEKTLQLMADKLTSAMEKDLRFYLKAHELQIKKDNSLIANYDVCSTGGYLVHCKSLDEEQVMLDITIHVNSPQQAETICNNWRARHEDVYAGLMDTLIQ